MAGRLQEIVATVVAEKFRFGDSEPFTLVMEALEAKGVVKDDRPLTDEPGGDDLSRREIVIKGKSENGTHGIEPAEKFTYIFYGEWRNYRNQRTGQDEKQFHFKTFVRATPHTQGGIVKYLTGAPNIGRVFAGRLWDKFQGEAVRILREEPEVAAAAVKGLSEEAAREAAEWLETEKTLENCTIELVGLLEGSGLPKGVVKAAIKVYGNLAAAVLKRDPYRLMQFRGCGFKRADALYLELGHDPAKLKRQALCAWHSIASRTTGDTWHFRQVADVALGSSIGGASVRSQQAIELASRGRIMLIQRTDGLNGPPDWDGSHEWLADARKARNELRLAQYIALAMKE